MNNSIINEKKAENDFNLSIKSLNLEKIKIISPALNPIRKSQILFQTNSITDKLKKKIGHLYDDDILTVNEINKNAVFRNSSKHIIDN